MDAVSAIGRTSFLIKSALEVDTMDVDLLPKFSAWLETPTDVEILNECARVFIEDGKPRLALLCLVESLRQQPAQGNALALVRPLLDACNPVPAPELPAEEVMVSVLMRTYNRTDEIRESIESVLDQTLTDLELIVINDHGDPAIEAIVTGYSDHRIRYQRLPKNAGQGGALNAGLVLARGRYVAFLDDDDVYLPDHLANLVQHLEAHPEIGAAYSGTWVCEGDMQNGRFIESARRQLQEPDQFDANRFSRSNFISLPALAFRRSLLRNSGLVNPELRHNEDWEFFLRISESAKFHRIDGISVEYRQKDDNISRDSIQMNFFSTLIFRYYHYARYRLLLLSDALKAGRASEILELFGRGLADYEKYRENRYAIRLLFYANLWLTQRGLAVLEQTLLNDNFSNAAWDSISSLFRARQYRRTGALLPAMARKALNRVKLNHKTYR